MVRGGRLAGLAALLPLALAAACGGGAAGGSGDSTVTLYTCISDTTIQPVLHAFERSNPGTRIALYRAPTGDLNARVAGDVRSGGLKADVIWACDPLTMQHWANQGLVGGWTPTSSIPAARRTADYVGASMLYMLAVTHRGVAPPRSWQDLTSSRFSGGIAVPDPSVAASALGAVGYFAHQRGYGLSYYGALKKNGAVQVSTPDDVVTGVAQGQYDAGITIANSAYAAKSDGSPIRISWPQPGAVAIYEPIAVAKQAANAAGAKALVSFVTSRRGQALVGKAGSYPALPGMPSPPMPAGAALVSPNWAAMAGHSNRLLVGYHRAFGG